MSEKASEHIGRAFLAALDKAMSETPPTEATRPTAHDHGNCELCDQLDAQILALTAERDEARQQHARLLTTVVACPHCDRTLTLNSALEKEAKR